MSTGPNADSSSSRRSPDQTVFGRFILRRLLGQGGTGEVWLAHDEKLEQDVALKFFSGAILGHATRHSLRLTHPNIVRIYDFVEDGHDAAISMEYVEGWSLWAMKVERPHQCFTVEEIEPWIRQLCAALEYAHHSADLVHRDLKPANLIINSRSQLKVTDFGIARNLSGAVGQLTAALPPLGTLGHISPQQTMGSEPSVLDDIYSLGATIYELLTGHPPFYKGEVLAQVQQLTPPSMTERRHELGVPEPARLPLSWEQTVAACLEKDPGRRPQSIAAVLQQLFPEVQPLPEPAVPVETDAIPAGGSRKLIFALVGVALAGVLLIAAVIYFLRPFSPRAHASITPASPTRPGAPNPAGEILATSIYLGADDFVVDVFHNGQRVPNAARSMTTEQYGAIGERTVLTVREGDWVVFNVANNRLRWGGSYYFGAAGVRDDKSIGFVSEESEQWSVCEEPGLVPRFIAEPLFLATNLARRIEKPWGGGDGMIKGRVKNWHGYAIWGSAENRNIWIKFYAKPAGK